jgi:hypothetical protein
MEVKMIQKAMLLAVLLLLPQVSKADNFTTINSTAVVMKEKNQFGPDIDAPFLVRITRDWYIGFEGGKDLVYTNISKGWYGYAKISYNGTILDFSKR